MSLARLVSLGMSRASTDPRERGSGSPTFDGRNLSAAAGGLASLPRCTSIGLAAGLAYGVCLRAWMRLVSTDPEFSWGGSGYIAGAFAVLGAMAGLVTAGRHRGWRRRLLASRIVGIVLSLGCFVAAGTLMFPTIVPGALGWARSDWPRPVRVGLVLLGLLPLSPSS